MIRSRSSFIARSRISSPPDVCILSSVFDAAAALSSIGYNNQVVARMWCRALGEQGFLRLSRAVFDLPCCIASVSRLFGLTRHEIRCQRSRRETVLHSTEIDPSIILNVTSDRIVNHGLQLRAGLHINYMKTKR